MNIGLLGGTFDPVHNGHLMMAQKAIHIGQLDHVFFIPSHRPPHKQLESVTSFQQRMDMLYIALKEQEKMTVNDIEGHRKNPSYTVETIHLLNDSYPATQWHFILGGDSVFELEKWKDHQELFQLTHFIAFERKEIQKNLKKHVEKLQEQYSLDILLTNENIPQISSTKIRELAEKGANIQPFVPNGVEKYIVEHRLYQE